MAKDYKRKEYIEKNYADAPKLPKRVKRAIEGSNRLKAKKEIRELVDEDEEPVDDYYEVEGELANLCFMAERLIGDEYRCTCPASVDKMREHIEELKQRLNRIYIQKVGE